MAIFHTEFIVGGMVGIIGSAVAFAGGILRDFTRAARERKSKSLESLYSPATRQLKYIMTLLNSMSVTAEQRDSVNPGVLSYSEEHANLTNGYHELASTLQIESQELMKIISSFLYLSYKWDIRCFNNIRDFFEAASIRQKIDKSIGPNVHQLFDRERLKFLSDQIQKRAEKLHS